MFYFLVFIILLIILSFFLISKILLYFEKKYNLNQEIVLKKEGKSKFKKFVFLLQNYVFLSCILCFGIIFLYVFVINNFIISYLNILLVFKYYIITGVLIIVFIYDLKYYIILNEVMVFGLIAVTVLNLILYYFDRIFNLTENIEILDPLNYIWGFVIGSGFFLLQYIISKGRWIGGGDIKFGAFLGAAFGVPNIILILFLSYWIGSLISLVLILLNKKKLTSWIPFGVFLVLGAFITMLFGDSILQWYYGLI